VLARYFTLRNSQCPDLKLVTGRILACFVVPVRDGCVPAVIAVMVHTDMPAYPAVLLEAARVLRPGGIFVHISVYPCFCGGFAPAGVSME
jgi:ubiquinone/menaquinone biosynthesis C-methylase UbiE